MNTLPSETASIPNVLVLVIDRLNAGYLGPYGNTWVPTPTINRLASESVLAEFAFATTTDFASAYRSYWQGLHPLSLTGSRSVSLPELWSMTERSTLLLTDEPQIKQLPLSQSFSQRVFIESPEPKAAAGAIEETQFAELIATTCEHLSSQTRPFAMWVHARGLSGAWDAPLELREHLRDEEDPEPPQFIAPPELRLPEDHDPDALLAFSQAYAAQVMVIDECLELLLETLQESGRTNDTLLVLTSPRGYLLGQQRYVGTSWPVLLADQLHLPLLLRYPAAHQAAERHMGLLEPRDLHTLLQTPLGFSAPIRDRVLSVSPTEHALRTPAWLLRAPLAAEAPRELYAKPDDRYEVNNVAGRCQTALDELAQQLEITTAALFSGDESTLLPLAEDLVDTYR